MNPRGVGGAAAVYAVDYPASYDFSAGAEGAVAASHQIETIAADCPRTNIFHGGYSHARAVAGYTVTDASPPGYVLESITGPLLAVIATHIAAVVVFGQGHESGLIMMHRQ